MTEKLTTTAAKKARKAKAAAPKPEETLSAKVAAVRGKKDTAPFDPSAPLKITEAKSTVNGSHLVVTAGNGEKFTIRSGLIGDKAFTEASRIGKDYRKAERLAKELTEAAKSPGNLARGLDARNAPQSVKAIADRKAKEPTSKPAAAPSAAGKKAERKVAAAAKAAPKADDNRKITIVDKKFSYGKPGSSRNASWLACTKAKTVAEYAKAGGALKYLPRWTAAGAIKLG